MVFRPQKATGPVLLFFHGGGWTNGYKEWMSFMAPAMSAAGIVFVSAGYRLAAKAVFPTGLMDTAAAVAWVYRTVSSHGGDPERLFVGGHSAGGHYTALLAVRRDWQTAIRLPRDVIRGCLPVSGVYDFTEGSGHQRARARAGGQWRRRPAAAAQHQDKPPPFLLARGSKTTSHAASRDMERALAEASGNVTRIVLEGCDHLSASYACGDARGTWAPAAVKFMQEF
jgi:acetyl esterase/lipase